jgi:ATP-dependent protease ClpP protease subunit
MSPGGGGEVLRKQAKGDGLPRDFFETLADGKFLSDVPISRVYVYGDITDGQADAFQSDMLLSVSRMRPILIHLNSYGGLVDTGFRMASILAESAAHVPVCVLVDGVAGSAATFLTTAAPYVVCLPESMFLIHSVAWRQTQRVVTMTQLMDEYNEAHQMHESLTDLYVRKTSMSRDRITKLLRSDRFLGARESEGAGLVSRVLNIDPVPKKPPPWLAGYLACIAKRNVMQLITEGTCNKRSGLASDACIAIDREFFGGVVRAGGGDGSFTTLVSSATTARPECVVFRTSSLLACSAGPDTVIPVAIRLRLVSARLPTIAVMDSLVDLPGIAIAACCTRRVMYRSATMAVTFPDDFSRSGRNVSPADADFNGGMTQDALLRIAGDLLPRDIADKLRQGKSVFLTAQETKDRGIVDELFE